MTSSLRHHYVIDSDWKLWRTLNVNTMVEVNPESFVRLVLVTNQSFCLARSWFWLARSAFGALNIKIQGVLHYALFLLRFATIHVMANTNTSTTTVAATTTMTLNDVVPARKYVESLPPTHWCVNQSKNEYLRVSGVLFEFLSSMMKISSPPSLLLWIGNSASISWPRETNGSSRRLTPRRLRVLPSQSGTHDA